MGKMRHSNLAKNRRFLIVQRIFLFLGRSLCTNGSCSFSFMLPFYAIDPQMPADAPWCRRLYAAI